ncbi:MAG: DUF1036 domain-containing protein [Alphaproteobacteria bacterium]
MRDTLRRVRRIALALILLTLGAPAEAAFNVCNKTDHATDVAFGFFDGKYWSSRGWWTVPPRSCTKLLNDNLLARYYYLFAVHHEVGGGWDGEHGFCVSGNGQFHIEDNRDCAKRGYDRKGFFQVDTGASLDWTENLAD